MMRSEAETRLSRRNLLLVDTGLWLAASFDLFKYVLNRPISLSDPWPSLFILFMLAWLLLIMIHTARVLSIEMREYSQRAVERQFRLLQAAYGKRKRDEHFSLTDDSEQLDFPPQKEKTQAAYER